MSKILGTSIKAPRQVRQTKFWDQFPGLVWSNSRAPDDVMIRAALSHPKFEQLVLIADEFGLNRLRKEWGILDQENTAETDKARTAVERILRNINQGFLHVKTRD